MTMATAVRAMMHRAGMIDARVKPAHDDLGCRAHFYGYNAKIIFDYVTDL
jgi:hypothetical protein